MPLLRQPDTVVTVVISIIVYSVNNSSFLRQVATAFVDEVKRLAILVDEFEKPFHPDRNVLRDYKKVTSSSCS